jgi:hypothetical protein
LADKEPWTTPAMIADPKVLDEIKDALKGKGWGCTPTPVIPAKAGIQFFLNLAR